MSVVGHHARQGTLKRKDRPQGECPARGVGRRAEQGDATWLSLPCCAGNMPQSNLGIMTIVSQMLDIFTCKAMTKGFGKVVEGKDNEMDGKIDDDKEHLLAL